MQRFLNLITSVILARLIAPEEFGIMAILLVFQAIAQVLMDGGFGQALIQKQELTQEDKNAVFCFNVTAGLLMFLVLYFAAPLIASFYQHAVLRPAIRLFSVGFLISSFGAVQATMLTRELRFRAHMIIALISTVCSAVLSIGLAFKGFGVWALVCGILVKLISETIGRWMFGNWVPTWKLDYSALRGLFSFSSKMLALTLIGQFAEQAYTLTIGKLHPAATLGFFYRARNLRQMSVQSFAQPMNVVMFPSFSRLQHDRERLKRVFMQSLDTAMLVYVPLVLGLASLSDQLIPLLYGERWLPAARFLKLLCWAIVFQPVTHFHSSLIKAVGRPGMRLKAELIVTPITLILIAAAAPFGIMTIVATAIIRGWLWAFIMTWFSAQVMSISYIKQGLLIGKFLMLGIVLFISMDLMGWLFPEMNIIIHLLLQMAVGLLCYTILLRLFAACSLKRFLDSLTDVIPRQWGRAITSLLRLTEFENKIEKLT